IPLKRSAVAADFFGSRGLATFCTFHLGRNLCGVDIGLVKEISPLPPLTWIPHAPGLVRGYVNLRGLIHRVLDLQRLLGMEWTEIGPETRLVLFKPILGDPFGVLVDRIATIVEISVSQVEDLGTTKELAEYEGDLVFGIAKLDGQLLHLVNAQNLLPGIQQSLAMEHESIDGA